MKPKKDPPASLHAECHHAIAQPTKIRPLPDAYITATQENRWFNYKNNLTCPILPDELKQWEQIADKLTIFPKLMDALKAIKKHQEMSCPTGYKMSTTWNIANEALLREAKG